MKTRLGIVAVTIGRFAAGAGVAGICAACSVTVPLTLVPEPSGSGSWGVLRGTATASGTGSGPVILPLPTGEILTGTFYHEVPDELILSNFGRHLVVLPVSGQTLGTISLSGATGITAYCEFVNVPAQPHGDGRCAFSNGYSYHMNY